MYLRVVPRQRLGGSPFTVPAARAAGAVNFHRDVASTGRLRTTSATPFGAGGDKLVGGVHRQLIGHFAAPFTAAVEGCNTKANA
jgi:hypothetical protein